MGEDDGPVSLGAVKPSGILQKAGDGAGEFPSCVDFADTGYTEVI